MKDHANYTECSVGRASSAPATSRGMLDENVMMAGALLTRLECANARLQGCVERFFGVEPSNSRAGDDTGFPPGLVNALTGRQHVQAVLIGQLEDKLERLESL